MNFRYLTILRVDSPGLQVSSCDMSIVLRFLTHSTLKVLSPSKK
jgi:hypothetical protein